MIEKSELEQLDKGWTVIRIVWSALAGSLLVYLLICKVIEGQLSPMTDFPFETMKLVLFGVSIATFFAAKFVRKAMLKSIVRDDASAFVQGPSSQIQHPAVSKYLTAIIVAAALSESIGICGLVLFFISKDSMTLYQFLALSAFSMFYYRPRKEELLQVAAEMQKNERKRGRS